MHRNDKFRLYLIYKQKTKPYGIYRKMFKFSLDDKKSIFKSVIIIAFIGLSLLLVLKAIWLIKNRKCKKLFQSMLMKAC